MAVDIGAMYAATYSVFLFVVVIAVAFFFNKGGAVGFVQGATFTGIRGVISMIPYALLAWGFIISFITLEFRYMIAPLYGLQAFVMCIIGSFIFGKFLPGIVSSSAAILTYYTYDYLVKNIRGNVVKNIMMTLLSFGILLAQVLTTPPASPGTYLFTASLLNDGLAAILGVSVGLGGWYTVLTANPELLPSSASSSISSPSKMDATTRTNLQKQLDDVNKDISYLEGLGLKPETNNTLKDRLATRASIQSALSA